ncbi:MAG: sugar phosphate isomerase/epimerase [Calditrichaeota bacterium]|nr:sugar phosphate isomerase/epimerase [Calditrichota bacterium]
MDRRAFLKASAALGLGAALHPLQLLGAPRTRLRLGVISDEVSQDPERAIALMKQFDLNWVELRGVWGKHVIFLDSYERRELRDLLGRYGVMVSNIASPTFKSTFPGSAPIMREGSAHPAELDQWEVLERAVDAAHYFNVPHIRAFAFWRVADGERKKLMPEIVNMLKKAVAYAERRGVAIVVENEYSTNVATGAEAGEFISNFDTPFAGILWDPGNAFMAGEHTWKEGYEKIPKGRIQHIHLKDVRIDPKTKRKHWVAVGDGVIGYVGQFRALIKDRYLGALSIETHYHTPTWEQSTIESLRGALRCIRQA